MNETELRSKFNSLKIFVIVEKKLLTQRAAATGELNVD